MKTVLYVDDNQDDLLAASKIFKNSGITLRCYNSAINALNELENAKYDLVVCDIIMPIYDGLQFAKRMAKIDIDVPLILTSGIEALDGFDSYSGLKNYKGFWLKPVTLDIMRKIENDGNHS